MVWRNWTGDQACAPAVIERVGDTREVAAAIERAAVAGRQVRVAGAGHSFTDAVLTDGTLLTLENMRRVVDVDRASGLVRVEAGITLGELAGTLWDHGLAFENLGDIAVQSLAGATATGTHGTGARLRNLSAALLSIELVTGDGRVVELSAEEDPDAWRAARVSVGALGVVTTVTLRTVPAFVLEGVDVGRPLEEVLESLGELVDGNDHFEFYAFPHSPLALTRTNNRVDLDPRPPRALSRWVEDVLVRNHALAAACRLGRARPKLIPAINRLASRLAAGESRRIDRSYRVFTAQRRVRFTEMEYAIPRRHAAEALRLAKAIAERPGFDVSFPIEVRFVAGDEALLSPAGGRDTCYIAVHVFEHMAWEPYFRAVEETMDGLDGRPHWGKRHFQTADTLAARYPQWDRFQEVRARLDPEGRFANGYVQRTLGPV